ncbi:NRPS-like enzyme [Penicillium macrosclerotiorum]|uniref:NRPS-like enzyme n=1 Tax=Penicillium macrosclerotiorum TaxID=303699 RepID=UPI0025476DF0|nr:NRPS-like enzyme [Penicillium macrosclerotiorum]KAJ5674190.1 NRPS-like enzyme [Penicillium macrosclerotiorum]
MPQNQDRKAYDPAGKLIPTILDELAANEPDRVYGTLPMSQTGYESGTRTITWRKLANAVNGIARWMTENLGPCENFETISYIGPHDMGHHIVCLAAMKAGYKGLFISPRYGTVGSVRLMKETGCENLLVSPLADTKTRDALVAEHGNLRSWTLPSLLDLFEVHQDFPYLKSYEEGKNDPMFVLHTSGTTGFPRPIFYPYKWGVALGQQRHRTAISGYKPLESTWMGKRIVSTTPPFHISFFLVGVILPFYSEATIIYPPATMPPTAKTIAHVAEHLPIDIVSFLPNNVEDLGSDINLQETFIKAGIKSIIWGGGPVAQKPGAAVAKLFNLFTTMGSSEDGIWQAIRREKNWDSYPFNGMTFHPDHNIEFRDQGDGLYLAVIVRNSDPQKIQPVFCLFPNLTEYNTKDLFRRHSGSGIDSVWFYHGRTDDMLIFPTGFKWFPGTSEEHIQTGHRDLFEKVLITVTGNNVVVLLEPTAALRQQMDRAQQSEDKEALNELRNTTLDQIWPTVEDLQRTCPSVVCFTRSRFIFTDADRPLLRTAKGTIRRKVSEELYKDQIEAAYGPEKQEVY